MISQLSSRLLKGLNNGSSNPGSDQDVSASSGSSGGRASSVGGYSADREGFTGSPPVHISLPMKHKRSFLTDSQERAKRKKLSERQYAAAVAKDDLKRAGVAIPAIRTKQPRAIPLAKLDMSKVQLVYSKDVKSSPFLTQAALGLNDEEQVKHDFVTDFGSAYGKLLDACRQAYNGLDMDTESTSSDTTSSMTMSDSEEDSGAPSKPIVLRARLDDSLPTDEATEFVTEQSSSPDHDISCPPEVSMTMEQALAVCGCARLMTLATSPFVVVHSNAACGELTGLNSSKILGKGLAKLLDQGTSKQDMSLASIAAAQNGLVVDIKDCQDESKVIKCQMKVTPIVSFVRSAQQDKSVQASSKVTHYAVDLTMAESTNDSNESQKVVARAETSVQKVPTTVVG